MDEYKQPESPVVEISYEDAGAFQALLSEFLKSYQEKPSGISDEQWLKGQYQKHLPEITEEKAAQMAAQSVQILGGYEADLSDLQESCTKGTPKEQWLADKLSDAAVGMSVNSFGDYLSKVDMAVYQANSQMLSVVTTNAGEISQALNLDGFIAEQQHVNQFNIRAALEKQPYRAVVCGPKPGVGFAKNSVDCIVKNTQTGKIYRYQMKYGATAEATAKLIREGNYTTQRLVVPADQVEALRKMFPNKSITAFIGGVENMPVKSDGFTKEELKELQTKTQSGELPVTDWNSMSTRELTLNLGKNAALAGMGAAGITAGFTLAKQVLDGNPIDVNEVATQAFNAGIDVGLKSVVAGTLTVGVEKGYIKVLPKGNPTLCATIAAVVVENAKILVKVGKGELTPIQGLDQMARTSIAMVKGLSWSAKGAAIGSSVLSVIPVVGPIIGGFVGGLIGYAAGSKVGNAIYSGVKYVAKIAVSLIGGLFSGIANAVSSLFERIFG